MRAFQGCPEVILRARKFPLGFTFWRKTHFRDKKNLFEVLACRETIIGLIVIKNI